MARLHTTKIEAEVDDLLLDLENPRIGTAKGQSDALESIVRLNTQHFRNMMASIKANDLDPGDSFYVIADEEDEGSYTVVDGNRRLAALKVLHNPDLLDGTHLSDSVKKRLRDASAEFAPV
ncbi:MAG: ParB N-terminal domain-containing protein, partial [Phreatobacter sp.]|nr:ParB N-terminal domain-containing protein [Phreatobacter sp.]